MRSKHESWIVAALLALLVIAAFANVVFGGRSLVPSDSHDPLDYRMRGPNPVPIEEWTSRGLVPYPNFRDLASAVMQTDPSREFFRRSLSRGEFPFWDPYLGGGAPSFASLVPAYFFPPSLVVVLLGNGRLITNVYILLLIFTSGVLTYFFLRRHVEHRTAAFAGAVAFMLSGAIVLTVPSVVGQPIAFFSLPLLMTARLIEAPGPKRAAQLALGFAFPALATFPPALLLMFGMTVLYLIVSRASARTAAWFAAGVVVSLAIVACVYLPAVLLMAETTHVRDYYRYAAEAIMPAKFLPQILSARIDGGVAIYANPAVGFDFGQHMYYTGVAALFLAGAGALARAANPRARALQVTALITAVLSVMKLVGLQPMQWVLTHVPFLRNFHYASYLGIGIAYAVALLAALGADALLRGDAKWPSIISASALAIWLIAFRIATRARVAAHPNGARWIADWRTLVAFLVLSAVLWSLVRYRPQAQVIVTLALLVLGAEGINNSFYPRPRPWDPWSSPPRYIQLMLARNSGGRVLPMPIFPANTESVFGLPTLDSILTASPRVYELYRRYFGPIPDVILRESTRIPPERVLDAADMEYFAIVSSDKANLAEVARRGYETLFADDYMHLVRRPTQPRYTFTSQYEVVDANRALTDLPNLPRGSVFVEEAPPFASTAGAEVQPRVVTFGLNDVTIHVDAPRAGLLVCSESNMRGWSATVDGRPARILAANYAFRAVAVPPGSHDIRFAYRAPGWTAGVVVSIVGLLLAVGMLAVTSRAFASRIIRTARLALAASLWRCEGMRKIALFVILLLTAVAAHAATTIYDVSGPSPFGFANQTVLVEAWHQNAIYNNVTITAPLEDNSSGGPIAGVEGTVYLTNSIGPGTTVANLVAPPVTISGLTNAFTVRTLFTGLNLPAGTYYLTFKSTNSNPLSMSMEGSSTPTFTLGPGVTDGGADGQINSDPFPPATAVTLNPPGNLFVTVTGDLVQNFAIPTMSTSILALLGIALAVLGLRFTVR